MNEVGVDPGIDHMLAMECFDDVKEHGGKVTHQCVCVCVCICVHACMRAYLCVLSCGGDSFWCSCSFVINLFLYQAFSVYGKRSSFKETD